MYSDPNLYSSAVMFEPPSERQPNVLRLQLTEGCDHNKCTYCNGFNGVKHCQKTKEQFIQHTDKVLDSLDGYKGEINRVFIGS
jgi:molybdenum cofactor biosynthesis enzyme MoaA